MLVLAPRRRARRSWCPSSRRRGSNPTERARCAPWAETADPIAMVAGSSVARRVLAIGDQTWTRFTLRSRPRARRDVRPGRAGDRTAAGGEGRAEIDALRAAAHAVDAVAAEMRIRPFGGRTELDVSRELVERMLEHGHERAELRDRRIGAERCLAAPRCRPTRVIGDGDVVVCDFGGTMAGYCSDITRMFVVGEPTAEVADIYAALADGPGARGAGRDRRDHVRGGRRRRSPARSPAHGLADAFIHRIGHGIGLDAHEDPYLVAGQRERRSSPATRSASSRASTSPAGSGCGWRTSSWPPTPAPTGSTARAARSRGRRLTCISISARSCSSGPPAGSRSCG